MNDPISDERALDARSLAERWTRMWNHELPAAAVVAPDCSTYFGRKPVTPRPETVRGPAELQAAIDAIREAIPGVRYGHRSAPLIARGDGEDITLLWEVEAPGKGRRSGIDVLRHRGGLITEVWSVTGDLELPPMG